MRERLTFWCDLPGVEPFFLFLFLHGYGMMYTMGESMIIRKFGRMNL